MAKNTRKRPIKLSELKAELEALQPPEQIEDAILVEKTETPVGALKAHVRENASKRNLFYSQDVQPIDKRAGDALEIRRNPRNRIEIQGAGPMPWDPKYAHRYSVRENPDKRLKELEAKTAEFDSPEARFAVEKNIVEAQVAKVDEVEGRRGAAVQELNHAAARLKAAKAKWEPFDKGNRPFWRKINSPDPSEANAALAQLEALHTPEMVAAREEYHQAEENYKTKLREAGELSAKKHRIKIPEKEAAANISNVRARAKARAALGLNLSMEKVANPSPTFDVNGYYTPFEHQPGPRPENMAEFAEARNTEYGLNIEGMRNISRENAARRITHEFMEPAREAAWNRHEVDNVAESARRHLDFLRNRERRSTLAARAENLPGLGGQISQGLPKNPRPTDFPHISVSPVEALHPTVGMPKEMGTYSSYDEMMRAVGQATQQVKPEAASLPYRFAVRHGDDGRYVLYDQVADAAKPGEEGTAAERRIKIRTEAYQNRNVKFIGGSAEYDKDRKLYTPKKRGATYKLTDAEGKKVAKTYPIKAEYANIGTPTVHATVLESASDPATLAEYQAAAEEAAFKNTGKNIRAVLRKVKPKDGEAAYEVINPVGGPPDLEVYEHQQTRLNKLRAYIEERNQRRNQSFDARVRDADPSLVQRAIEKEHIESTLGFKDNESLAEARSRRYAEGTEGPRSLREQSKPWLGIAKSRMGGRVSITNLSEDSPEFLALTRSGTKQHIIHSPSHLRGAVSNMLKNNPDGEVHVIRLPRQDTVLAFEAVGRGLGFPPTSDAEGAHGHKKIPRVTDIFDAGDNEDLGTEDRLINSFEAKRQEAAAAKVQNTRIKELVGQPSSLHPTLSQADLDHPVMGQKVRAGAIARMLAMEDDMKAMNAYLGVKHREIQFRPTWGLVTQHNALASLHEELRRNVTRAHGVLNPHNAEVEIAKTATDPYPPLSNYPKKTAPAPVEAPKIETKSMVEVTDENLAALDSADSEVVKARHQTVLDAEKASPVPEVLQDEVSPQAKVTNLRETLRTIGTTKTVDEALEAAEKVSPAGEASSVTGTETPPAERVAPAAPAVRASTPRASTRRIANKATEEALMAAARTGAEYKEGAGPPAGAESPTGGETPPAERVAPAAARPPTIRAAAPVVETPPDDAADLGPANKGGEEAPTPEPEKAAKPAGRRAQSPRANKGTTEALAAAKNLAPQETAAPDPVEEVATPPAQAPKIRAATEPTVRPAAPEGTSAPTGDEVSQPPAPRAQTASTRRGSARGNGRLAAAVSNAGLANTEGAITGSTGVPDWIDASPNVVLSVDKPQHAIGPEAHAPAPTAEEQGRLRRRAIRRQLGIRLAEQGDIEAPHTARTAVAGDINPPSTRSAVRGDVEAPYNPRAAVAGDIEGAASATRGLEAEGRSFGRLAKMAKAAKGAGEVGLGIVAAGALAAGAYAGYKALTRTSVDDVKEGYQKTNPTKAWDQLSAADKYNARNRLAPRIEIKEGEIEAWRKEYRNSK